MVGKSGAKWDSRTRQNRVVPEVRAERSIVSSTFVLVAVLIYVR